MTKQTRESLIRSLLTIAGSFLLGHNLLGHKIDESLFQEIGGAAIALSGIIWGMIDKTTNLETWESIVRSVGLALGSLGLALGLITKENLAAIISMGGVLVPIILANIGRVKVKQIDSGQIVPDATTGKVLKSGPKVSIILALLCMSMFAQAQSVFKPIPRAAAFTSTFGVHAQAVVVKDSTYTGLRLMGPAILYALPNSAIFTGVGISYEHDTYKVDTHKWYTDWSVALGGYAGGQYAPNNIQAVTAVGLSVSFFNKLVTMGLLYNLTTRQAQGGVGPSVSLNN